MFIKKIFNKFSTGYIDSPENSQVAGEGVTGDFELMVKQKYREFLYNRLLRVGRIAAVFSCISLPYFIYQDLYLADLPFSIIYFRLIPTVFAIIFLLLSFILSVKYITLIKVVYQFFLGSAMLMMFALVHYTQGTPYFRDGLMGLIMIIFAVAIFSNGGFRFLLPVYLVPSVFFVLFLSLHDISRDVIITLSNPVVFMVGMLLFVKFYEQMRFREFRTRQIIDEKNEIIDSTNQTLLLELELAEKVQNNLIPRNAPVVVGMKFHFIFQPMRSIGGDFFDFLRFKNNNLTGIFICDVSGHGVHAALIASMVKTLIETAGLTRLKPGDMLAYINRNIRGMIPGNFLTAFYGIYDNLEHTLTYARGGHPYPILLKNNGTLSELKSRGIMVGVFPDRQFEEKIVHLEKGDKVLFYTDGLTETRDSGNRMFLEEFESLISQLSNLNVHEFINTLYNALNDHRGDVEFEDDICMIGMEVE